MQTDNATAIAPDFATRMAVAAGEKLRNLAPQVHPGWVQSLLTTFDFIDIDAFPPELLSDALMEQFDLRWPDLSALTAPAQALWLLPKDDIVHYCQCQAVFERRGQLLRCMDGGLRRQIRLMVGERILEAILQVPFGIGDVVETQIPVDPDDLAFEGFKMLRDLFPGTDSRHWRIAAMTFAPDANPPDSISGNAARVKPKAGAYEFVELAKELFPEHAWLFGLTLGSKQ